MYYRRYDNEQFTFEHQGAYVATVAFFVFNKLLTDKPFAYNNVLPSHAMSTVVLLHFSRLNNLVWNALSENEKQKLVLILTYT